MNLYDVFDDAGVDGVDNKKSWDRLPTIFRYFVSSTQHNLVDRVVKKVGEIYGEDGLKSLVKTSGFRSINTNRRNNGVVDSLHLFGCAVDFAKVGIFKNKPIPTCCELECLDSGKCWHVQFKRGK